MTIQDLLLLTGKYTVNAATVSLAQWTQKPISRPSVIFLDITTRCNARCVMCNLWGKKAESYDVPLETLKRRIDDLHHWLGRGHLQLGLGESLLHPHIFELAAYAQSKKMLIGTISNGLLITDKVAEQIIRHNFFNLNVSLDGIKPATHNFTRGLPGAFDKVMNALESLLFYRKKLHGKTRLIIKPIIFNKNLDELIPLVHFAKDKGLDAINFQPLVNLNNTPELLHFDNLRDLHDTLENLKTLRRQGYPILNTDRELDAFYEYFVNPDKRPSQLTKKCAVGYTNLWIAKSDQVYFCYHLEVNRLNLNDYPSLHDLWISPAAQAVRRQIAACRRPCLESCLIKRTWAEQVGRFRTLFRRS
jgi:MoaA/NifB/PqqE/SkfB family radical SAM enzyme